MVIVLLSLLIGVVAGLRAMTAPAVVSWAAHLGWLPLEGTWLAFLGYAWTPWILTVLALAELVTDQLPSTPSRTLPVQFGTRILMGAVTGAALAAPSGMIIGTIIAVGAGILGAIIGTLGGRAARGRLAAAFGADRPAAIIEDIVAIVGALAIVMVLR